MTRILIGVPAYRVVEVETAQSLVSIVHRTMVVRPSVELMFAWAKGLPVAGCIHCYGDVPEFHDARNGFAETALKLDCTHVFMVDSDMAVEDSRLLLNMLDRRVDVVGALYAKRGTGFGLASMVDENGDYRSTPLKGPFEERHAVGAGVMLVTTECLRGMKRPWFAWEAVDGKWLSEDTNFCRKAREAGCSVYCDASTPVGHIGTHRYMVDTGGKSK